MIVGCPGIDEYGEPINVDLAPGMEIWARPDLVPYVISDVGKVVSRRTVPAGTIGICNIVGVLATKTSVKDDDGIEYRVVWISEEDAREAHDESGVHPTVPIDHDYPKNRPSDVRRGHRYEFQGFVNLVNYAVGPDKPDWFGLATHFRVTEVKELINGTWTPVARTTPHRSYLAEITVA